MNTSNAHNRRTLAALGLGVLLASSVGCREQRSEDIPPGAMPLPLGSSVREFNHRQATKGRADSFVFYRYEWSLQTAQLTDWGRRHLSRVLSTVHRESFPVIIESSGDERLDEARRRTIIAALAQHELDYPERRVVVAHPDALDISGDEAVIIQQQFIRNVQQGQQNITSVSGQSGN